VYRTEFGRGRKDSGTGCDGGWRSTTRGDRDVGFMEFSSFFWLSGEVLRMKTGEEEQKARRSYFVSCQDRENGGLGLGIGDQRNFTGSREVLCRN
jgi:hypothetical protein